MGKYFLSSTYGGVRILDYLTLLKILAGCVLLGCGSFTTEEAVKDYKFRVFGPWLESKESKLLLVSLPQKEWQQIEIRAFPGSRLYQSLPIEEKQLLFELNKLNEDFRDASIPLAVNSSVAGFFYPYATLGLLSMNLLTKFCIQKHYLDNTKALPAKATDQSSQKHPTPQQSEDTGNTLQVATNLKRLSLANQISEIALYALPIISILMHASKVKL